MSALAGIFNFNNVPLREEQREQLLLLWNGLKERGPDSGDIVFQGSVAMCYRAFHTNRESRLERQPYTGRNKELLAGDLRLDNRDELISKLRGLLRKAAGEITDIELSMAAYERWGETFPLHLIGEFALVLFDPRRNTFLMARDYIGARTLYWYKDNERLICSTDMTSLVNAVGIEREVNDEYVAGFLARYPEPGLTPYKNIHAVKPAHSIVITVAGQSREQRFWGLDPNKEIRYQKDQDYEEDLKIHLFDAVRSTLRTDLPAMAELSGGLDSSTIVCVADQIISRGETQTSSLETVSSVSDESPQSDERRFIRQVEEKRGKQGHHLRDEDFPFLSSVLDWGSITTLNPLLISAEYHRGVCETMRKINARVLLSGEGGDQIMGGASDLAPQLGDLLLKWRLRLLHKLLKTWSQEQKRSYFELLLRRVVVPMLPLKAQVILNTEESKRLPAWVNPNFAHRMQLRERLMGVTDTFNFHLPSARDQSIGFISVVKCISIGWRQEIAGVDVSYPFLHRPLVEFMQAIPPEQNVRPGQTRSLMRRTLRDVLPEKIRTRRSKGNPTEIVLKAFAREASRLRATLEDARVCHLGYVESAPLLVALERATHGCESHYPALVSTICLEFWLRALDLQSSAARKLAVPGQYVPRSSAVPIGADMVGAA